MGKFDDINKKNTNNTSTQLFVESRVDRALVVRVEDVRLIAARRAALHCGVEASGAVELGGEAPGAAGRADAVAARRFTRAGVLCKQLLSPLTQAYPHKARPHEQSQYRSLHCDSIFRS